MDELFMYKMLIYKGIITNYMNWCDCFNPPTPPTQKKGKRNMNNILGAAAVHHR